MGLCDSNSKSVLPSGAGDPKSLGPGRQQKLVERAREWVGAGTNQRRLASFLLRCPHGKLRIHIEPHVNIFSKEAEDLDLNMESLQFIMQAIPFKNI